MVDPATALAAALDNSTKVANTPLFSTIIDKLLGFKISEWGAQGETIKKQILDGYEEAKQKGLGIQYVSAFRSNTNLINTSIKAAKYIDASKSNNVAIDNDVFWGFLKHSEEISNEEMQELIAKIIAGEYNKPGSYTMSTLQTVKMLGKTELELFERTASFLVDSERIPEEIFALGDDVKGFMKDSHVDYGTLLTLQSLGVFLPNEMSRTIPNPNNNPFRSVYFDKNFRFEPITKEGKEIKLSSFYGLSEVGKEILPHLNPQYNDSYYTWLTKHYQVPDYKLKE